ncbi:SHOCT domain-containing protein [Chloroflexota bacterium]
MWYMHEGMSWWAVFGGIWMVLFWGGIIALIVWGISKIGRQGDYARKQDALDIAKGRYARGEIAKEEFEQIKKVLL